jgi:hypothetical protein
MVSNIEAVQQSIATGRSNVTVQSDGPARCSEVSRPKEKQANEVYQCDEPCGVMVIEFRWQLLSLNVISYFIYLECRVAVFIVGIVNEGQIGSATNILR